MEKQAKTTRNILLGLLGFLGTGAIGGGTLFIISPNGDMMGMPVTLLENSPFNNYLLPGIILFTLLGLVPFWLIRVLLKKPDSRLAEQFNFFSDMHWTWTYSVYTAFILICWILAQLIFFATVDRLHIFMIFYALIIIFVALLPKVRILYKK